MFARILGRLNVETGLVPALLLATCVGVSAADPPGGGNAKPPAAAALVKAGYTKGPDGKWVKPEKVNPDQKTPEKKDTDKKDAVTDTIPKSK